MSDAPAHIPPLPWSYEQSSRPGANGAFHLYLVDANGRKIAAVWGKSDEKLAAAERILQVVNSAVEGQDDAQWRRMSSAPRDGNPFICQNLWYGEPQLCMRRVRYEVRGTKVEVVDLGSWIFVGEIDDEINDGRSSSAGPVQSIAPDDSNRTDIWWWRPIPKPPQTILDTIETEFRAGLAGREAK